MVRVDSSVFFFNKLFMWIVVEIYGNGNENALKHQYRSQKEAEKSAGEYNYMLSDNADMDGRVRDRNHIFVVRKL